MSKLTTRRNGRKLCRTCYTEAEEGHLSHNICKFVLQRARALRRLMQ